VSKTIFLGVVGHPIEPLTQSTLIFALQEKKQTHGNSIMTLKPPFISLCLLFHHCHHCFANAAVHGVCIWRETRFTLCNKVWYSNLQT